MIILIGHNDTAYLTTGWHPVQDGPGGVTCRWMSQRAEIAIPGAAGNAQALPQPPPLREIIITLSAPAEISGRKPGLSLYTGNTLLGHCPDLGPENHWATAIFSLTPPVSPVAPLLLKLAMESRENETVIPLAFVPHEVLQNGDLRELGSLVSTVRLS